MKITNKILVILTFLYIHISCKNDSIEKESQQGEMIENETSLSDEQVKNAGIILGKIEKRPISEVLKINGKIDAPPQNLISISMPLGGYLKSTKLLPGMYVKKGEILASMEDMQYIQLQQDFLMAKNQLDMYLKEFNRQKQLNESKASSDKVLEQAQANYQSQIILVKSMGEKLKLIGINPERLSPDNITKSVNIISPVSGFISSVNTNIGKYINPEDVMFEIVDPDDIHLVLTVYEKDVEKLSLGQKVYAYTNNHPTERHEAEIILISNSLGTKNTAEVNCHLKNITKSLFPVHL
jgi:membrane fusion protein, heavy metal efflux system